MTLYNKNVFISFICCMLCILFLCPVDSTGEDAREEDLVYFEDKYLKTYPKDFFSTGGEKVTYNPNIHLKIGIIVRNNSSLPIKEVIEKIFSVAPFDRYRDFFVFVRQEDIERGKRNKDFFIRAYNSYGREIPGGFDIGQSSIQAGLIVLNVENYEFSKTGTKGYAKDKTATAQKMTILHELGHALADLGDEYSIKENEKYVEKRRSYQSIGLSYDHMHYKVWNSEYPNIDYRSHSILKWEPLIEQGFINDRRIKRIQIKDGEDVGRFLIPTDRCIMNRILNDAMEFCPVCQLQIIDRICQLSGAIPPWYRSDE